ncbi:hypothetical protein ASPWEDRAFT_705658 [Aspergillus wentii DTO 134E9]|uniref:Uncharacterized protein n=1 Tax=Aspergillus wentii DTO 134E9 TaxID=1073089 RepID=A0A1L9R5W8_ASPWE|nr:uncharacterized protein ASPWEDRAFT_705658 [Aspergillus wentii DTO 134E9]KAI9925195.1 hypothetical protein MW887_006115 [Aspergillus wentii]OJJ30316.1 hypothetical protein ASPWEDRAFT_705658 [Aspergillus wentii DTO 134E9]
MLSRITSISQHGLAATRSLRQFHPPIASSAQQTRAFHGAPSLRTSDSNKEQDRTTLNPERSEVTKSGTDSEVAQHPAAYDPSKTSPESEIQATEEESRQEGKVSNPLDMSPANKDVSDWAQEEGDSSHQKTTASSRGQTHKHKTVNPGLRKK